MGHINIVYLSVMPDMRDDNPVTQHTFDIMTLWVFWNALKAIP